MKVAVYRKEYFNAAHRLNNPGWDELKNKKVFGKCNNPNFHGHNYELVVRLTGDVDPETGYVYDLKSLGDLIKKEVIEKLDHRNLNLDIAEFMNVNPTAENIAIYIWNNLRRKLSKEYEIKVTLYETERNIVEYPA
ncbi:MAG TPA: 6-carboxytetrahydropterin synthase [Cyclobacteriaceae bacterium]|nr:6-carboxytetrahydropterin synthase [Cyclobacteriaceae bacterium]